MTTSAPSSDDSLVLYGQRFDSRLLLGTSRYPSPAVLEAAVQRARPPWSRPRCAARAAMPPRPVPASGNCSEAGRARAAQHGRLHDRAGSRDHGPDGTRSLRDPWIKLELIGDDYTLQPDTLNLVEAASILIKDGFQVLPYTTEDLVLCQRLVDVGCQAVMPWAAPIGTGRGPVNPYAMQTLRERLKVPLIVDAGLGRLARLPGHGMGL